MLNQVVLNVAKGSGTVGKIGNNLLTNVAIVASFAVVIVLIWMIVLDVNKMKTSNGGSIWGIFIKVLGAFLILGLIWALVDWQRFADLFKGIGVKGVQGANNIIQDITE